MVMAEFETVDGMYRLSCSFVEEPAFSVVMYGDEPKSVMVAGETVRAVEI